MERLKRSRRPERSAVSKLITVLEGEIQKNPLDKPEIEISMQLLEQLQAKLEDLDDRVKGAMLDVEETTDEQFEAECVAVNEYNSKILKIKYTVNSLLYPAAAPNSPQNTIHSHCSASTHSKKTLKLPKIEFKKFGGELTEWLGWWAQFEGIHEDEDLHDADKFTYLVQCMTVGTRAFELVSSYPQSKDNYPKVVKALKERYGNPKLLKQVYVRELIAMIIMTKNRDKMTLASLYDKLESHLRSLESLGVTVDQMVEFLFPMVESSLPEDILLAWQRSANFGRDGTLENPPKTELDFLMSFLKQEIENEEQRNMARNGFGGVTKDEEKKRFPRRRGAHEDVPTAAGLFNGTSSKVSCLFCEKDNHESKKCFKAKSMTMEDRKNKVMQKGACFLCLKPGHMSRACSLQVSCPVCRKRHQVLFCPDSQGNKSTRSNTTEKGEPVPTVQTNLNCTEEVLLRTLMVRMVNPATSKVKKVRVLLDCGSQRSYVLKKTAVELGLVPVKTLTVNHQLFGGTEVTNVQHQVYDFTLRRVTGSFSKTVRVMDQDLICGVVPRVSREPWVEELRKKGVVINDTVQTDPMEIEVLIGADLLGDILTGKLFRLENGLTAIETCLGWTLMGPLKHNTEESLAMTVLSMSFSCATVSELWSLDTLGIRDPIEVKTREEREIAAQDHFQKTVERRPDGRYSVSLPWIDEGMPIPTNREVAMKRLESATRKLNSLGKYEDYDVILKSWESEGIISKVNEDNRTGHGKVHYVPHRAVFKPESLTTPVRPVFDASCKVGRAPSLNDCLEKGPNLLELIPSVLLRFRMGKIGVISDIRKAFLMIEINEDDRDAVRFLWWEDPEKKKVAVYRHNRVVFGMNCSPFLLGAVLNHHLNGADPQHVEVVHKMRNSLYVDNCVLAVDDEEEYKDFKKASTELLAEAQMELRSWECSGDEAEQRVTSVLGLKWDKSADRLYIDLVSSELPSKITKRVILSQLHQIYDPLGFLSPVLLIPKLLLQKAWIENRQWDEEVSGDVRAEFVKWWDELIPLLKNFSVPRNCTGGLKKGTGKYQLHVFSDACKYCFATVIFIRSESSEGVTVQLLMSKSRVAPVKPSTIPRLELMGCVIGARLLDSVKQALSMENVPVHFWSDSTTALSWIKRSDEWGTFVGNRVREILTLSSSENWHFVPGSMNPADLPSRGISPSKFMETRWWEGPSWLKEEKNWPRIEYQMDEEEVNRERKKNITTLTVNSAVKPWYVVTGSYHSNLSVMSLVFRFVDKLKRKSGECSLSPTLDELRSSELRLYKLVQSEVFSSRDSVICGLKVIRDQEGSIRVKTKLLNRDDSLGFKLPVLLPHSHQFVDLLIRHEHTFNCHGGAQFMMGILREKCWIVQGRAAVKKVIRACVECQRYTAKKSEVPSSALPEDRVRDAGAFEVIGIDLAGPLMLRNGAKVWIVLFTCAVYRGVHLELVESLSTEDFLLAFTRFCRRKRRPVTIYTDNGKNFVGAVNLFKKINWEDVEKRTRQHRIQWKFIPPSAPWWGGWWERLIRSVKDLLKRMMGFRKLTAAELETCLCEAEYVINHRPLTFVTEDQEDLVPLTPAMFMYDLPMSDVPEAKMLKGSVLDSKKRSLSQLLQELKDRFRKEYLGLLVQRGKEKLTHDYKVGDIVFVERDDQKRIFWPMARIVELFPGKDGVARMARLKTKSGELVRALQRLYPLEVSQEETLYPVLQEKRTVVAPQPQTQDVPQSPQLTTRSGRVVRKPIKFCDY